MRWPCSSAEKWVASSRPHHGDRRRAAGKTLSQRRKVAQVASGILASRVSGLLRTKVLAHVFGVGPLSDVWTIAIKGPNVLQNLLGEQALSASFIPIYIRKISRDEEEADRFAGAVLALLLLVLSALVVGGILLARPLVALTNPGLLLDAAAVSEGTLRIDRFPLAVAAVRVLLPMMGILVVGAWCQGILNSHDRFFLSYVAPVLWNGAIITAIVLAGGVLTGGSVDGTRVLFSACWGALAGAALQVGVQAPVVLRLLGRLRLRPSLRAEGVGEALRRFFPALAGRSAAQLSAYVDLFIASFLTVGSLAALAWAQTLYLLPVALFGLSAAAVELPRLSRQVVDGDPGPMMGRLRESFSQMIFLTVPSVVAYLVFGRLVVGLLYESGSFGPDDAALVTLVLAVYTLGLVATTTSRLLQSLFFAVGDTASPARVAFVRLAIAGGCGALMSLALDRFRVADLGLGVGGELLSLGAVGLALGSSISAWFEVRMLLRLLRRRVGELRLPWEDVVSCLRNAAAAAAVAGLVWWLLRQQGLWIRALPVLAVFAAAYFGLALRQGSDEARALLRAVRRR